MALNSITLTSGMRQNLFALQQTQTLMETTQQRLSTGKRVNSALDDPINFFAAQGHTQRANDRRCARMKCRKPSRPSRPPTTGFRPSPT